MHLFGRKVNATVQVLVESYDKESETTFLQFKDLLELLKDYSTDFAEVNIKLTKADNVSYDDVTFEEASISSFYKNYIEGLGTSSKLQDHSNDSVIQNIFDQLEKDKVALLRFDLTSERVVKGLNDKNISEIITNDMYIILDEATEKDVFNKIIQIEDIWRTLIEFGKANILLACLRAYVCRPDYVASDREKFINNEIMNSEQVKKFAELSGRTIVDLLLDPNCRVLRESAARYQKMRKKQ